ncbi:protein S100-G-like [Eleutherodactylus coqui]|uniref:protein S100-G-like n=1 Tax=Eleutherodactylus coqui TaxID=57060 RepID=UPI0034631EA6
MVACLDIKLRLVVIFCLFCSPVLSKKNTMPLLEKILTDFSKIYSKYAKLEGKEDAMSVTEFTLFLKESFTKFLEGKKPDAVERLLASIDDDQDGELSFKEYVNFLMQYLAALGNNQKRM